MLSVGEVGDDGDERAHFGAVVLDFFGAELGHPCAGTLALAREEVGIEDAHELSVAVGDFISLHVGVVDFNVRVFFEAETV